MSNPVYHALISGDRHLASGTGNARYFDETVSPFVGFDEKNPKGFDELYDVLPAGRLILHATPDNIRTPRGWQLLHKARGLQMILGDEYRPKPLSVQPVPLNDQHIEEMVQLATLTRPGPFGTGTISFGHYYGVFAGSGLVAMTGQRLHVNNHTEISAVCTHPDHLGKGYGYALVQHQAELIRSQDRTPFLHVRDDNHRAIELYRRMGFHVSRNMNFYFMKRRSRRRA